MAENFGIVHLTDLHFPTDGSWPPWATEFIDWVGSYATRQDLDIYSFAITGDLVNSPRKKSYSTVKDFLAKALETAELTKPGQHGQPEEPDWDRVWIVGGNHDYRLLGIIGASGKKLNKSGLNVLEEAFKDNQKGIHVYGLHSGKSGRLARGRIEFKELKKLNNGDNLSESDIEASSICRIALIHHHLVPVPQPPEEWDTSKIEKIRRVIHDEAWMLLGNAGLTTAVLLECGFNLVLHGHRHKQLFTKIKYIGPKSWEQPLTILGGPEAKHGFHLLRFQKSGDLDLIVHELGDHTYKPEDPVLIWNNAEWKTCIWNKQKQVMGYYDSINIRVALTDTGNSRQIYTASNLHGGVGQLPIEIIKLNLESVPETRGVIAIESFRDLQNNRPEDISRIKPGNLVEHDFELRPQATAEIIHKGYEWECSTGNLYSITRYDARLRPLCTKKSGVSDDQEKYIFGFRYPVRSLNLWFYFPMGFAPEHVEIKALLENTSNGADVIDEAETYRAESSLHYDPYGGIVHLMLDSILPDHTYELIWNLPDINVEHSLEEIEISAKPYYEAILNSGPKDKSSWINKALLDLKDDLLKLGLNDMDSNKEALDVGLMVLDPATRDVNVAAGTYQHNSGYWGHSLPWGMGIRGLALRRGKPEFYIEKAGNQSVYYIAPPSCHKDRFLLAVPIVIPPNQKRPLFKVPLGFFKAAICVNSPSNSSRLLELKDAELREKVCDKINKFSKEMWEESPLSGQKKSPLSGP